MLFSRPNTYHQANGKKIPVSDFALRSLAGVRLAYLIGTTLYIGWGLLFPLFGPHLKDPLWLRYLIGGIVFASIFRSYYSSDPEKILSRVTIFVGFSMTLQSLFLIHINAFNMMYIVAYFLFLIAFLAIIQSQFVMLCYLAYCVCLNILLFFLTPPQSMSGFLFMVAGNVTVAMSGGLSKFLQLKLVNKLQLSEAQNSLIFSNINDGIAMHDLEGNIIYANATLAHMLDLKESDLLGKNPFKGDAVYFDAEGKILTEENLPLNQALQKDVTVKDFVLGISQKQKEISWLSVKAVPVYSPNQPDKKLGILSTLHDITELKKSHDLNLQQSAKLAEASKLRTLGEMTTGIAHEVNNPLTIIIAKSHQLKDRLPTAPAEIQAIIDAIESTAFRISKVIKGLNFYARNGEKDPFENASLKNIVDNTLALCHKKLIKDRVCINVDIPEDLQLECRPVQISQVLLNLIQNAVDAQEGMSEKKIGIEAIERDGLVDLKVWDYGSGIHRDIAGKIMNPFFSTKQVGKGTGLGLSISAGILENHGGKLSLAKNSSPTTFQAILPRYHPSDASV